MFRKKRKCAFSYNVPTPLNYLYDVMLYVCWFQLSWMSFKKSFKNLTKKKIINIWICGLMEPFGFSLFKGYLTDQLFIILRWNYVSSPLEKTVKLLLTCYDGEVYSIVILRQLQFIQRFTWQLNQKGCSIFFAFCLAILTKFLSISMFSKQTREYSFKIIQLVKLFNQTKFYWKIRKN